MGNKDNNTEENEITTFYGATAPGPDVVYDIYSFMGIVWTSGRI